MLKVADCVFLKVCNAEPERSCQTHTPSFPHVIATSSMVLLCDPSQNKSHKQFSFESG